MHTSARNVFRGTVSSITSGAVNDEIQIALPGGAVIVAGITQASTKRLGLGVGKEALAMIKASTVILMNDADDYLLSTRNQFAGTIRKVVPGAVNGEVVLALPDGTEITAIVTMGSIARLGLKEGGKAMAIVKATNVIVAVSK